jgi:hypothetical protein
MLGVRSLQTKREKFSGLSLLLLLLLSLCRLL